MGKNKIEETIEYDSKIVDQYNRIRERENGPYAYKHIKKKKTITKDNDFELWLELQAMNCIYIIYQDEIENEDELKSGLFSKKKNNFEMPLADYKGIVEKCKRLLDGDSSAYSDILDEMEDICQENNLKDKDRDRVSELYPYLYGYTILLENDDISEKELKNIIDGFNRTETLEKQEELVVHESKTSFIEEDDDEDEMRFRIQPKKEEVDNEVTPDESIIITFDNDYLNYRNGKYEGQEDGDYVYSNKATGDLICRENDNNLWLELQAMNFINKLFKQDLKEIKEYNLSVEDSSKKVFTVPEKETVIAIRTYNKQVDEKELKTYLYGLCKAYSVKESNIEKVFELYPYFCAYTWVKSYKLSATKALVELKNIPKLVYDSEEEFEIEEEKFIIEFDKDFFKYKVAIMEDDETIYCDEANSSYVSEDNKKELWIKLQAMNFVSKVYKLDKAQDFTLPEDLYLNVLSSYVNNEKITDESLKSICEVNNLNKSEYKKVLELYPYFCGYVISEKNNLPYETCINIVEKVKGMLRNEEDVFQAQENTMVLKMPNNEIIDKFLNRLNQ